MSQSKHDKALEIIIRHPDILIPDKIYWSAKETNFYRESGDLLCQPNYLAYTRKGDLYIIEYKATDNYNNRCKARHQLNRAKRFVEDLGFNGRIETIFVSGKIK